MSTDFYTRVAEVQSTLHAPKNQRNSFGNYNYRSCEDIMEAVKPLLKGLVLTVNDDVVLVGDRIYVKATATITDGEHTISNTAFAREAAIKKGMDDSQITGAASSYARKYALNGLFLIDDNKDADTQSKKDNDAVTNAVEGMKLFDDLDSLRSYYKTLSKEVRQKINPEFTAYAETLKGKEAA